MVAERFIGAAEPLLGLLEGAESRRRDLLRVLTYHRVGDGARFARQAAWLARRYCVVGVAELLDFYRLARPLPPRSVMITFDDADRDVAEVAWPVLRRHGLPAVLFVPTAYPDRPEMVFWWDRLEQALLGTRRRGVLGTPIGALDLETEAQRREAIRRLKRGLRAAGHDQAIETTDRICRDLDAPTPVSRVLSWPQLRRLSREGLSLAPHSRTHPLMDRISTAQAECEVCGARDDLRREVGEPPPVFAYPYGRHGPAALAALRGAGFVAAFSTRRGTNDLRRADPLRLRRINIGPAATLAVLRARLIHSSVHLNRWRPLFDPQRALGGDRPRKGG